MKESILISKKKLPQLNVIKNSPGDELVLFYDVRLSKQLTGWKNKFKVNIPLTAGENLKSLASFEKVTLQLIKKLNTSSRKNLVFVAVGGGSIGDFVGFLASLYKRGVRLVHIPSTGLAAIDSSHGGKTALNVGPYKNQIGTFYPADKVILVEELLKQQNSQLQKSAMGEFYKSCLLDKKLFDEVSVSNLNHQKLLWSYLPMAIGFKNKVVKKDPYEQKGIREQLNLGHTIGHVIEAHFKLPHGIAVGIGCRLSLEWSVQKKLLSQAQYKKAIDLADQLMLPKLDKNLTMSAAQFKKLVLADKKKSNTGKVLFVFLNRIGSPLLMPVSISELVQFSKKAGLVR